MNRLFTLLLFCCSAITLSGQSPDHEVDRLLDKIEADYTNDPTVYADTILADCDRALDLLTDKNSSTAATIYYYQCGAHSYNKNFKASEMVCQTAIDKIKRLDAYDPELLLMSHTHLAVAKMKARQFDEGLTTINKGIELTAPQLDSTHYAMGTALLRKARIIRRQGDYRQAIAVAKQSIPAFEANPEKLKPLSSTLYSTMGNAYNRIGDYFNAHQNYQKCLAVNQADNPNSDNTADTYYNFANNYLVVGAYQKALDHYDKAIAIYKQTGDEDNVLSRAYSGKGVVYRRRGDYERALTFYKKAEALILEENNPYPPNFGTTYLNIGSCYRYMKRYPESKENLEKALGIYRDFFKKEHLYIARGLAHLGQTEFKLGNEQTALRRFDESLDNYQKINPEHYYIAYVLASKADIYRHQQRLELAFETIEQALQHTKTINYQSPEVYNWLGAKAGLLLEMGETEAAIELINKVLPKTGFDDKTVHSIGAIDNIRPAIKLLEVKGKALFQQYSQKGDITLLKKSAKQYDHSVELLSHLYAQHQSDNAQLFELEKHFGIITDAVQIYKTLFDQTGHPSFAETAFYIVEKTKSINLMETLEKRQLMTMADIDPAILKREQLLKGNLEWYERLRYKENQKEEPDQAALTGFDLQIFDYKNALAAFQDTLDGYLKPFEEKHDFDVDIETVKTALSDEHKAAIEYFLTDSTLYLFTIVNNNLYFDTVSMSENFKTTVLDYCNTLANPTQNLNRNLSQIISKKLLATPFRYFSENNVNDITVIPDAWLGYLPFETLDKLDENPKPLIEDYNISYAYAAYLLLKQQKMSSGQIGKTIATFAPYYEPGNNAIAEILKTRGGTTRSELPGAQQEARQIAQLFGGDAFVGQVVTEKHFRQVAANYQLLHLSMHAEMDDENPLYSRFIFNAGTDSLQDGILTAAELYNLQLNADLAVLSACNTGFGSIQKGEGIMSLSRAFQHTGVPATVMSLWKVPDDATSTLMTKFYELLKTGHRKDDALRLAKLHYLDQTVTPEQRRPFYWAGFVAAGNMEAIQTGHSKWWLWVIGGMVLMFLFFQSARVISSPHKRLK